MNKKIHKCSILTDAWLQNTVENFKNNGLGFKSDINKQINIINNTSLFIKGFFDHR